MKFWQRKSVILLTVVGLLLLAAATVTAQSSDTQGKLAGAVYTDANGDGVCVGTGIAGENPVPGVEIVFVSSDKATVVSLTTGSDGTYGLAAAGQSIWEVTARPDSTKWIVTSKNPLFVPVLPDTGLVQTDVNFCISQGSPAGPNAVIVLPQSGAAANSPMQTGVMVTAVLGALILLVGLALEWRRRKAIG
ncbi:MAG TPA: hypothetical protein PLD25_29145 [Chloroflexota bacterium]|nr:hypothetical protein [Chloroflexota bacterium]HUM70685.1 hypothetical protein [Chloroflexota bacterium]